MTCAYRKPVHRKPLGASLRCGRLTAELELALSYCIQANGRFQYRYLALLSGPDLVEGRFHPGIHEHLLV
jgi:hypothetical protein